MKIESAGEFAPYHNGSTKNPLRRRSDGRPKALPVEDREIIAWDMEGITHAPGEKQASVIWGSSKDKAPMVGRNLQSIDMLRHIVDVAGRNPGCIHVGYGFRYDANMLIRDLPADYVLRLWKTNRLQFKVGGEEWKIQLFPGKMLRLSRTVLKQKVSCTIYDYSSFFGTTFLNVAEQILKEKLTKSERDTIDRGKKQRTANTWDDIDEMLHYWRCEIQLMRRVFEEFRDVMCKAGFPLRDWYGPGALANFIIASRKLRANLACAQTTSGRMPNMVHQASKHAFAGGRFELFKVGRITGPVYEIDINSAYPHALTMIPDLSEGEWVHERRPANIARFGFYRISYRSPYNTLEGRPNPLFHRTGDGRIYFPCNVDGWYASPEARMMLNDPHAEIREGWFWVPSKDIMPWTFLSDMYLRRKRLQDAKNPMELAFKLGPNSLYGKLAQTVGWDKKKKLPPKNHALPVAAWITSYARSQLFRVMAQIPQRDLIAVETDAVFTTANPESLDITLGEDLGDWGMETFDELVYLQSGMYFTRVGEIWSAKSRGLHKTELDYSIARDYLQSLRPADRWPVLEIATKPRFLGAGIANALHGGIEENHCVWREQTREIKLGRVGKRVHMWKYCEACLSGIGPNEAGHNLVVPIPGFEGMSSPRKLPWEGPLSPFVQHLREQEKLGKEVLSG